MESVLDDTAPGDEHGELKQRLLQKTIEVLKEDGIDALSLRRLAEACDTSTQMIYTIFGGKQGLLEQLYEQGAKRLEQRCRSIPGDTDPLTRLRKLGSVYREFAREHRELYEAMFHSTETGEAIVKRTDVFDVFYGAIIDCIDEGLLPDVDPVEVTDAFWAAAHGALNLETAGYYSDGEMAEKRFDQVLNAVFEGYGGTLPS